MYSYVTMYINSLYLNERNIGKFVVFYACAREMFIYVDQIKLVNTENVSLFL